MVWVLNYISVSQQSIFQNYCQLYFPKYLDTNRILVAHCKADLSVAFDVPLGTNLCRFINYQFKCCIFPKFMFSILTFVFPYVLPARWLWYSITTLSYEFFANSLISVEKYIFTFQSFPSDQLEVSYYIKVPIRIFNHWNLYMPLHDKIVKD